MLLEVTLMSKWVLFEDALIEIALSEKPMCKGHIEVRPKKEAKAMSDLSDEEISHLFYGASYAATALFELMGAHGTNILVNEDDNQLCVHVLARAEGDGLNFLWEPKQADPSDLKDAASSIKDKLDYELWAIKNPEKAAKKNSPVQSAPAEVISADSSEDKDGNVNYLLKSLRRVP